MNTIKLLWEFSRLRGNLRKSRQEISALQEKKLRALLVYAFDHSAWHRGRFQVAGIRREQLSSIPLVELPTMDKAGLLNHFDQIVTVPGVYQEDLRRFDADESRRGQLFQGKYHIVHSSGSTGKPGYFLYDSAAWDQMLLGIIRGALWGMTGPEIARLLLGGPRIVYLAATGGRYGGAMAVGDGVEGLRAAQLHLDVNTPLPELVEQVRAFRPNIIIGYPSAVKILGELVQSGELELDVLRVISCGEPLGNGLREYFEQVFHADVVNFYGASESLALGVESNQADGMYLFDDLNVIEVADGAMYLTCLYNLAQPLIRYRLSDRLSLRPADNKYPFTRSENIQGRSEDLLWFENGGRRDFLHPLSIEGFCIEGLLDVQFCQTGPASFEVRMETAPEVRQETVEGELRRQLTTILSEKGLVHVDFTLRQVAKIPPDPRTGKKRLVIPLATSSGDAREEAAI